MSLLNDTLMDLDKAKRKRPEFIQGQGSAIRGIHSLAYLRQFALPFVAVLVVLLWLIFEKNSFGIMSNHKSVTAVEKEVTTKKSEAAPQNPKIKLAAAPAEKVAQIPSQNASIENAAKAELTVISVAAEQADSPDTVDSKEDVQSEPPVESIRQNSIAQSNAAAQNKKQKIGSVQRSNMDQSKDDFVNSSNYDLRLAEAIHSGRYSKYENKAWALIDSRESSRWTAMALADVYAANKNIGPLLQLVNRMRDRDPLAFAYVQSQWLIIHGDLKGAADILEPHRSSSLEYPYVLRLLAGVRSSLNEYSIALPMYRQLTELPNLNVNDWLGYAIALEHKGDVRAALQAYQKISGVRHADRRINRFVNERIRDLATRGNE